MPVSLLFIRLVDIQLNAQALLNKVDMCKLAGELKTIFKGHLSIIRQSKDELFLQLAIFPFLTSLYLIPQDRGILKFLMSTFRKQDLVVNISAPLFKGKKLPRSFAADCVPLIIGRLPAGVSAGAS